MAFTSPSAGKSPAHTSLFIGDGIAAALTDDKKSIVQQQISAWLESQDITDELRKNHVIAQVLGNPQLIQAISVSGIGGLYSTLSTLVGQAASFVKTPATAQGKAGTAGGADGTSADPLSKYASLRDRTFGWGTGDYRGALSGNQSDAITPAVREAAINAGVGWALGVFGMTGSDIMILAKAELQKASFDKLKAVGFTKEGVVALAEFANIHNEKHPDNPIDADDLADKVTADIKAFDPQDQKIIAQATERYLKAVNAAAKQPENPALQAKAETERKTFNETLDSHADKPEEKKAAADMMQRFDAAITTFNDATRTDEKVAEKADKADQEILAQLGASQAASANPKEGVNGSLSPSEEKSTTAPVQKPKPVLQPK